MRPALRVVKIDLVMTPKPKGSVYLHSYFYDIFWYIYDKIEVFCT